MRGATRMRSLGVSLAPFRFFPAAKWGKSPDSCLAFVRYCARAAEHEGLQAARARMGAARGLWSMGDCEIRMPAWAFAWGSGLRARGVPSSVVSTECEENFAACGPPPHSFSVVFRFAVH